MAELTDRRQILRVSYINGWCGFFLKALSAPPRSMALALGVKGPSNARASKRHVVASRFLGFPAAPVEAEEALLNICSRRAVISVVSPWKRFRLTLGDFGI